MLCFHFILLFVVVVLAVLLCDFRREIFLTYFAYRIVSCFP